VGMIREDICLQICRTDTLVLSPSDKRVSRSKTWWRGSRETNVPNLIVNLSSSSSFYPVCQRREREAKRDQAWIRTTRLVSTVSLISRTLSPRLDGLKDKQTLVIGVNALGVQDNNSTLQQQLSASKSNVFCCSKVQEGVEGARYRRL